MNKVPNLTLDDWQNSLIDTSLVADLRSIDSDGIFYIVEFPNCEQNSNLLKCFPPPEPAVKVSSQDEIEKILVEVSEPPPAPTERYSLLPVGNKMDVTVVHFESIDEFFMEPVVLPNQVNCVQQFCLS